MFAKGVSDGNRQDCNPEPASSPENGNAGWPLGLNSEQTQKSRTGKDDGRKERGPSDTELMKERFAKLLLGEDMSGGGKGVSSALALSNAITNLAASVFGEQHRLEPMSVERKSRWRKEIDWLLSVTDHIVEFVPSKQTTNGATFEIMITCQRKDLFVNIPALRKLDAMLIETLDNFKDQKEFWYVKRGEDNDNSHADKQDDKWWLPRPEVPPEGLSDISRKWLQLQKDNVTQVLKLSMAINSQVLSEMQIPEAYIESLPKNGRASLGDAIYKSITVDVFDPGQFLASMDLSTEHKIVDLKNRIEASVVIWQRKMNNKDSKSSWGSTVSMEKREQFEERAEIILLLLKQRFPGISQSSLDISKIQYNRDVGQALIESYSRILETLAHTVLSRIDDVLYADSLMQNPSAKQSRGLITDKGPVKLNAGEELTKLSTMENAVTLSDFMGWHFDQEEELEMEKAENTEEFVKKPPDVIPTKRFSYIETLGSMRSPTARH